MKRSYIKLMIFEIVILCFLIFNIFTQNIINKYVVIFLLLGMILFFKKKFGTEKIKKRYTKELCVEITIVYILFFVIYYLFGIISGYYRINNYFTFYGITTFIIPITLVIILKEYFRYLIYTKIEKNKILYSTTFIMFVLLDAINIIKLSTFSSTQSIFFFIAISFLPIISNNIVASSIVKISNYKVNIFWLLIINLYTYIIPIIPNVGDYILSIIKITLPLIIYSRVYKFHENTEDKEVEREIKKPNLLPYFISIGVTLVLIYFASGFFRYQAIAIASSSMSPKIKKGDIVVIDKKHKEPEVGQVIAYKYKNVIVVHRLIKKVEKDEIYYYTKGDSNNALDNYVVNEEDIIGIVSIKIPYLGLPTVWLNDL